LLVAREYGTDRINYVESADGVLWSQPRRLPGIKAGVARPYDMYDMVTDSAGHVHLVVVGYLAGSDAMRVLHTEWNGWSWSSPETITTSPPYPEYPRLALSQGNRLHVVWFGGDKPAIGRSPTGGIWYTTELTSAPQRLGLLGAAPHAAPATSGARAAQMPEVPAAPVATAMVLPMASRLNYEGGRSQEGLAALSDQPGAPILAALLAALAVLSIAIGAHFGAFTSFRNVIQRRSPSE
jgi:hypothetical protein